MNGVVIVLGVGKAVVLTMLRGPPEGSSLQPYGSDRPHDECKDPGRLEAAMGKVPMIACGNGPHSYHVAGEHYLDGEPAYSGEENTDDRSDVNSHEHAQARQIQGSEMFYGR
jgi:hypothetical protein